MSLPNKGKLLALDIGQRKTGVALTDAEQRVAFPREEFLHKNNEELSAQVTQFIEEESIVGLIMGLPLGMDGEDSEQTQSVRELHEAWQEALPIPITLIDERWTSFQARRHHKKGLIDSEAAQILLETYLG